MNTETTKLIKVTPYLKVSNYNNYEYLNSPGYVSKVCKPDYDKCAEYYCSGNSIYRYNSSSAVNISEIQDNVEYFYTIPRIIKSNFNLNYISLTSDIEPFIRTFEISSNQQTISQKQIIASIQSIISSYIFEFTYTFLFILL